MIRGGETVGWRGDDSFMEQWVFSWVKATLIE